MVRANDNAFLAQLIAATPGYSMPCKNDTRAWAAARPRAPRCIAGCMCTPVGAGPGKARHEVMGSRALYNTNKECVEVVVFFLCSVPEGFK